MNKDCGSQYSECNSWYCPGRTRLVGIEAAAVSDIWYVMKHKDRLIGWE